ncbi:MAG: hypothetical protein BRD44_06480 [Bacteroidetes bacterium QS_7_67_15]|nr:MAG: hypothetical protein BRD44_06480 [Bacteroidetes bacterium QS_7_67_15]
MQQMKATGAEPTLSEDNLTGVTRIEGESEKAPGGGLRKDAGWKLILRLTERFERLGASDGGWSILYRDPADERLWELTYPQGHLHGGGPPLLRVVSEEEAAEKYGARAAFRQGKGEGL